VVKQQQRKNGAQAELEELDLPPGIESAAPSEAGEDDDEDFEDFEVYTFVVTYQNGFVRRVFDRVPLPEVLQRWSAMLGRKAPLLMFPSDGTPIVIPAVEADGEVEAEDEVTLAPVAARADLILDILEEEDDVEEEDDDEVAPPKVLEGSLSGPSDLPPGI
jgi:hypothetical protein